MCQITTYQIFFAVLILDLASVTKMERGLYGYLYKRVQTDSLIV